ncbi:MAG TPA: hypothetical protein VIG33_14905 [Pseudobdellovibrionaceae bacterium]|jgi:hypothetical protein
MHKNYYRYTFEKFDKDGNPTIQCNYDITGKIGEIFVYSGEVDEMVKVDLEVFERRHVSKFAELQTEVYLIVKDQDFISSVRYGT